MGKFYNDILKISIGNISYNTFEFVQPTGIFAVSLRRIEIDVFVLIYDHKNKYSKAVKKIE